MFIDRVKKTQGMMKSRGVGILLLFPGVNTYYFTGLMKSPSERFMTIIIPDAGEPVAVVPKFEIESIMKASKIEFRDVKGWKEHENPFALVSKSLTELGKAKSNIGIDGKMQYTFFHGIQAVLTDAHFVDASDLLAEMRLIKSIDELELIRKAAHIACKGIKAVFESVSSGRSEIELVDILRDEIKKKGGVCRNGTVLVGSNSPLQHYASTDKQITRNEIILIDVSATYQWYVGDVTRTAVLGQPTERQKRIYEVVLKAEKIACEAARPGLEAQELDSTARAIITEAGFGQYFTHRLGHGLGLEVHEGPYIVEGNSLKLQPGMVHTIEPGIYLPDEFGVRIEDDIAITQHGCSNLSSDAYPKDELISLLR